MTQPAPDASPGSADEAVPCNRKRCPERAVFVVTGRCLACQGQRLSPVCDEHRAELTTYMLLGVIRSTCCGALAVLAKVETL